MMTNKHVFEVSVQVWILESPINTWDLPPHIITALKDTHLNWSLKQNWCYNIYPKCSGYEVSTQVKLLMDDWSGQGLH